MVYGQPLEVTVLPILLDRCPVCMPVCCIGVLCPSGWMDKESRCHLVRR